MALRKTKVILEARWDDEWSDHPMGWDWNFLTETNPERGERVRLIDAIDDDPPTHKDENN